MADQAAVLAHHVAGGADARQLPLGPLGDAAVLYEEMGRGPLPGPFFSSAVLGALVVMEAGSEAQRGRLLPAIAVTESRRRRRESNPRSVSNRVSGRR